MTKAHDVRDIKFSGTTLTMMVGGRQYRFEVSRLSERLARATPRQRESFELSPSGYGIHWPELDEDLSIDGLLGIVHAPAAEPAPAVADRPRA